MHIDENTVLLLKAVINSVKYHVANKNVDVANEALDMLLDDMREEAVEEKAMTNKTMPKRIFASKDRASDYEGIFSEHQTADMIGPTAEYIRTDIADGDPKEPLADGQYRWFKSRWRENIWQVGMVCTICSGLEFNHYAFCVFSGDYVDEDDVIKVGPVLRPPEDKS